MVKYLIEIFVATAVGAVAVGAWPEIERRLYLHKVRTNCPHPEHLFDPDQDQPDPEHYTGFCMECFQKVTYCLKA